MLERLAEIMAAAPPGQRHVTLVRVSRTAGGLIPYGLSPEEIEAVLFQAALASGHRDPHYKIRDTIRWGLRVGQAYPLEMEERV
jgi:hypothetical protein